MPRHAHLAEVWAPGVEPVGAVELGAEDDPGAQVAEVEWPVAHERQCPQAGMKARTEVVAWVRCR